MGCAWAAFTSYGVMMLTSNFVGKAKYPIPYEVKRIFSYIGIAIVLYVVGMYCLTPWAAVNAVLRFFIIIAFVVIVVKRENVPMPGKLKSLLHL
jgi:hypothetical protein